LPVLLDLTSMGAREGWVKPTTQAIFFRLAVNYNTELAGLSQIKF